MMRTTYRLTFLLAVLAGVPGMAHKNKRTDPCGCHHQYGLRHCHPNQKSETCEAPAKDQNAKDRDTRSEPSKKRVPVRI